METDTFIGQYEDKILFWKKEDNNVYVEMFTVCNKSFYIDIEDLKTISLLKNKNNSKVKWYVNDIDQIYCRISRKINYLIDILNDKKSYYISDNKYDNRRSNFRKHKQSYKILEDQHGKYFEMISSNNKGTFLFDYQDFEKITTFKTDKGNRPNWYITVTGKTGEGRDLKYVCCRNNQKMIYLHALIMEHMFQGKGNNSVDHIDRNPFNNRRHNLRIVTQSEQNENTGKRQRFPVGKSSIPGGGRSRKHNAKKLPDGLLQSEIPKYVVYYREKYAPEKYRDFFRIEKHPLQKTGQFKNKWATSKSMGLSIQQKLQQAVGKLNELNQVGEL